MTTILNKGLAVLDKTVELIVAAVFFLMVIVGGMQVFNRYLLNSSLSWSEEMQKFMHIWIIFLAIPLGYKNDVHIGMKVFSDKLPRIIRYFLVLLTDCLWFALGATMVFYTFKMSRIVRSQTSPGLGLRMDHVYFCVILGGCYLCVMAVRKFITHLGGDDPATGAAATVAANSAPNESAENKAS